MKLSLDLQCFTSKVGWRGQDKKQIGEEKKRKDIPRTEVESKTETLKNIKKLLDVYPLQIND